ncbi:uncharacterized protein [Rutidosis leptorrhynchoides]|uniref:uncharacterized protein n=1 Tax=Rutidosis leptorrhynchoides TaxID=125765 RepID=UPI003A98E3FD
MACVNMQVKNEKQGCYMGPRISFSNDFIDSNHHQINNTYTEAPVSSDFEFSVPTFSSNSADEVFFKGKMSPLKENVITLRDELLASHDDDDDDHHHHHGMFNSTKNSSGWWKEKFGLRKSQNGKNVGGLETIDEAKIKPSFFSPNFTGSNRYK